MDWIRRYLNTETLAYILLITLIQLAYLVGSLTYPNAQFGFNQLNTIPPITNLFIFMAFWSIGIFYQSYQARKSTCSSLPRTITRWWLPIAVLLAAYSFMIFYLFNNNFINPDGIALLEKIPRDVPIIGAHLTHDEMLELFLHSRFWFYTQQLYGWSVEHSYRVLSALGGAFFIFLLIVLAKLSTPSSKLSFLALMLSGGYIQLFFGDVENYTLVSVLILLYLCLAYLYTKNRIALWVVGLSLSIALGFHLLAGWLIPSFLYLCLLSWKKQDRNSILLGFLGFITPIILLLAYFHWNGLPIDNLLYKSHSAGVLRHSKHYLNPFQGSDCILFLNLLFLLLPSMMLFPPLLIFRRIRSDSYTRFLTVAGFSMLAFVLLWRLQLGVYEDWNLVAPALIPLSTLIAFSYAHMPEATKNKSILVVFFLTTTLHTSMWILSNHFSF